jgi:hypothetical protein
LHWDKIRAPAAGTVWERAAERAAAVLVAAANGSPSAAERKKNRRKKNGEGGGDNNNNASEDKEASSDAAGEEPSSSSRPPLELDMAALEALFRVMESKAAAKLAGSSTETDKNAPVTAIQLVEHRRAHNICIELAGIRMPFAAIKEALLTLKGAEAEALSVEQLSALARAVPEDSERRDLRLYLKGEHPRHRGVSDPALLGTVERYFLEVMDIPRLKVRRLGERARARERREEKKRKMMNEEKKNKKNSPRKKNFKKQFPRSASPASPSPAPAAPPSTAPQTSSRL